MCIRDSTYILYEPTYPPTHSLMNNPSTHPPTGPPTTHHVLQLYSSTYSSTCMRWYTILLHTYRVYSCAVVGFQFFYDSPPSRGASDLSPGGPPSTRPARRGGNWRSCFRRGHGGLLCGAGVAPLRGRGRVSEARDNFVFSAVLVFAEFYLEFSVGAAISLSFSLFRFCLKF